MPSLVYKVLLEVYSRVSLVAKHRLHPAELAEQIREGYALRDRPAMRADLRVPSLFAECLSYSPTVSADVPKLASTGGSVRGHEHRESEDFVQSLALL